MEIDVSAALRGEIRRIDFEYDADSPENLPDVSFTGRVHIRGAFTNQSGYMELSLTASLPYTTHCARCFKEISGVFTLDFAKPAALSGTLSDGQDAEDYLLIKKGFIDPDPALIEALTLEFPMVFLCKEDCKGLCPRCGKDLNEGDCGCPKKEIDPRLAILGKLLDK